MTITFRRITSFKYPVIKITVDETRMWCVQTIGLDGVPGEET